jgi:hypothetical protein
MGWVMSKFAINGKEYDIPEGKSIEIRNGKVYVDGEPVDDTPETKHSVITGEIKAESIDLFAGSKETRNE